MKIRATDGVIDQYQADEPYLLLLKCLACLEAIRSVQNIARCLASR